MAATHSIPSLAVTVAGDHAIFLDCVRDKYFTLSPRENAAVVDLLAGRPIDPPARCALRAVLGDATADRLRTLLPPAVPPGLQTMPFPQRSRRRDRAAALGHLAAAALTLKTRGLRAALERAAPDPEHTNSRLRELEAIAAAHAWLSRHVTAHDACLLRSLALARHARAHRCATQLVIAVRTEPFAAHCWVQAGATLLNEEPEVVASFTPILVLT